MNQWAAKRVNSHSERQAKSIPCHVTKVDKDFIEVAFETANSIFTPPTVKIPQSWSQYSREPTQVKDKGYAVPGNYYLGGVTGDSGGNTDFYPRGNLTTLSFNGTSHKQNPDRDYDQLTHMAGPNGWVAGAFQKQQQDNQQQQTSSSPAVAQNVQAATYDRARRMSIQRSILAKTRNVSIQSLLTPIVTDATTSGTSSTDQSNQQQQQQQDDNKTNFNFDKNNLCTIQSKDDKHNITVDQKDQKITLNLPVGEWGYAGGDGKQGQYSRIMTEDGPSVNFKARIG
jgi:hypothetical protein